ncbi:hypothetical protein MP638_001594 [Amoeboaphelidium occidentale]|nr:hypothetical protein MP638_001594 [Amoeboaphelidium occidentale]
MGSRKLDKASIENILLDVTYNSESLDQKQVYLRDEEKGYIEAVLIKGDLEFPNLTASSIVTIRILSTGEERNVPFSCVDLRNPPKYDQCEDLSQLSYLNQSAVYANLHDRYMNDKIYTYSGLFLVAINPWKTLDIYSDEHLTKYKTSVKREDHEPHIYAVCNEAYKEMVENKQNQTLLITGESGAGKTMNTSKAIQYFAKTAGNSSLTEKETHLDAKIMKANPILEAFGNAMTVKNNNSSRFGKFIRLQFSAGGELSGVSIEHYLLEKGRVSMHSASERNFHIFYQLLKGADANLKASLGLREVSDYDCLKGVNHIQGVDDSSDFKNTVEALTVIGLNEGEQFNIWRVLSAILLFCNLHFEQGNDDLAIIKNLDDFKELAQVLQVDFKEFEKALLRPTMKAGDDDITQTITTDKALFTARAMGRAIYERLFGWIVSRINLSLQNDSYSSFIGCLDIAGFEIFENNSFEQLCINLTNEKLQQFFNNRMFKLEQETYVQEGLEWTMVDFGLDLQPTIDLIEKPLGIMSILDEECLFPRANDKTFITKLKKTLQQKEGSPERKGSVDSEESVQNKFSTVRLKPDSFVLRHYADEVEYDTTGWLIKNKDPISEPLSLVLSTSANPLIKWLFKKEESVNVSAPAARKKGSQFVTVAQRHTRQLNDLMKELEKTNPHFVRCIIPNDQKRAGHMAAKLVINQLKCNGVLEGIRITRLGYPSRIKFSDFNKRYSMLTSNLMDSSPIKAREVAERIIHDLGLSTKSYTFGKTKIFLKSGVVAKLEELRNIKTSAVILKVQARIRGFLLRKKVVRTQNKVSAVKIIQKNARLLAEMKDDPWLQLFTRLKPLIPVYQQERSRKEFEEGAKKAKEDLEQQLIMLSKKHSTEMDTLKKKYDVEISALMAKFNELESNHKVLISASDEMKQEMSYKEETLEKMKESVDYYSKELKDKQFIIQKHQQSIKSKEDIIITLNKHLNQERESNAKLKAEITENNSKHNEIVDSFSKELSQMKEDLINQEDYYNNELHVKLKLINEDIKKQAEVKEDLMLKNEELTITVDNLTSKLAQIEQEKEKVEVRARDITTERSTFSEELARTKTELSRTKTELSLVQGKLDSLRQGSEELNKEIADLRKTNSDLHQTKVEYNTIAMKFKQLQHELQLSKKREQELVESSEAVSSQLETNSLEMHDLVCKYDELDAKHGSVLKEYEVVKAELKDLKQESQNQIKTLTKELEELRLQKSEFEFNYKSSENVVGKVSSELNTLQQKLSDSELLLASLQKEKKSWEQKHQALESESKSSLEQLEDKLKLAVVDKENTETKLNDVTLQLQELESSRKSLETHLQKKRKSLSTVEQDASKMSEIILQQKQEILQLKNAKESSDSNFEKASRTLANTQKELNALSEKLMMKQGDSAKAIRELHEKLLKKEAELKQENSRIIDEKREVEKQNEKLISEIEILRSSSDHASKEVKRMAVQISKLEKEIEDLKLYDLELKDEAHELATENETLQKRLDYYVSLESEHTKLKRTTAVFEDEVNSDKLMFQQEISTLNSENKHLKEQFKKLTDQYSDVHARYEKLFNQHKMLKRLGKEAQAALEKELGINDTLEKSNYELQNANRNLQSKLDQTISEQELARKTLVSRFESKFDLLNSFVNQLTSENQELSQSKRSLEQQLQKASLNIQELQLQNNNFSAALSEHKQNLDVLSNLRETKKKIIDLEYKIESLDSENEQLKRNLSREREKAKRLASKSRSNSVVAAEESESLRETVLDILQKPVPPIPDERRSSLTSRKDQ